MSGDVPPLSRASRLKRLTRLSRKSKRNPDSSPSDNLFQHGHSSDSPQDEGMTSKGEGDGQLLFGATDEGPSRPSEGVDKSNVQPEHESSPATSSEINKSDIQRDHEVSPAPGDPRARSNVQPEKEPNPTSANDTPKSQEQSEHVSESTSPMRSDQSNGQRSYETELTSQDESDEPGSYDLKPPQPRGSRSTVEIVASRLFSADHLDLILRDSNQAVRFRRFLNTYMPQHATALTQYVESRKAFAAVEYANAIAQHMPRGPDDSPFTAASFDDTFGANLTQVSQALIEEALPAYITNSLVSIVTESLVKDISGTNAPFMKELIPNLAEVYCISDPSMDDNPIVYASEGFFTTTLYNREYVLGRNCRFLRGPETSQTTSGHLSDALNAGEESCEIILNYRSNGSPFLNLLMIAPLYDDQGKVRYFLGSQIDVTPLLDKGKGVSSFAELLAHDSSGSQQKQGTKDDSFNALGELGEMLNESEVSFIENKLRRNGHQSPDPSSKKRSNTRRVLNEDGDTPVAPSKEHALWPDQSLGHSGRLPGVYQNYLLLRPHPSLRITFASPALRIPGLLQTKFLDRVGGSEQVREGLLDALSNGTNVTAHITWLSDSAHGADNKSTAGGDGKPCWIHCTPLVGSDEKVGVWMIVFVEEEAVTGSLNRQESTRSSRPATPMKSSEVGSKHSSSGFAADHFLKDNERPTQGSQGNTSSP